MRSAGRFTLVSALASILLAGCGGDDTGSSSTGQGGAGGQSGTTTTGGGGDGVTTAATTTVSSTVATTTVASSSAASTGSGEIACPIGGYASFDQTDCDMLQQDCEPGFTCERKRVGGVTVTKCVERSGLKGVASACDVDEECESGLFCAFNVCTPVCCPSNDEPCDGGNCNLEFSYSADDSVRLCTYSRQCNPLTESACPPGSGCHFEEPTVATCIQPSGNDVAEGEPCGALNDCDDMQQCVGTNGICRWICAIGDTTSEPGLGGCPAGQSCIETQAVGIDGLGVCDPT